MALSLTLPSSNLPSIGARRPEIVLVEKKFSIIDIAVPADVRCIEKKIDKVDKYQDMKREICRIWQMSGKGGSGCD